MVFPGCWDAVGLFTRLSECTLYAGMMGTPVGLDRAEFWRLLKATRKAKYLLYPEASDLYLYDQFLILEKAFISQLAAGR